MHFEEYPHSLLPRFFGAHKLHFPRRGPTFPSRTVCFVVMANVFGSPREIHEKYDLKGSTVGRTAGASLFAEVSIDLHVSLPLYAHKGLPYSHQV